MKNTEQQDNTTDSWLAFFFFTTRSDKRSERQEGLCHLQQKVKYWWIDSDKGRES